VNIAAEVTFGLTKRGVPHKVDFGKTNTKTMNIGTLSHKVVENNVPSVFIEVFTYCKLPIYNILIHSGYGVPSLLFSN